MVLLEADPILDDGSFTLQFVQLQGAGLVPFVLFGLQMGLLFGVRLFPFLTFGLNALTDLITFCLQFGDLLFAQGLQFVCLLKPGGGEVGFGVANGGFVERFLALDFDFFCLDRLQPGIVFGLELGAAVFPFGEQDLPESFAFGLNEPLGLDRGFVQLGFEGGPQSLDTLDFSGKLLTGSVDSVAVFLQFGQQFRSNGSAPAFEVGSFLLESDSGGFDLDEDVLGVGETSGEFGFVAFEFLASLFESGFHRELLGEEGTFFALERRNPFLHQSLTLHELGVLLLELLKNLDGFEQEL